ncbi:MAG TPA: thiolase family protein [Acidimicrobiia bacterium]|nr:thiolase family protein [Acidimicrobiia bacterium]
MPAHDWGRAKPLDDIAGDVAIAGIGETAYTKASGRTAKEIGAEAAERAIADAGLDPADVDGLTYSGAFADFDVAAFHEHFGTSHDMWSSPWGGGMTWAGTAPYLAARAIRDGRARHILNVFPVAWATQRSSMTGGPGETHATQPLKQNLEVPFGWFPQPVYFATIARRHMLEFGTTPEQLGAIAVAARRHANLNPDAVMHGRPMTIDAYLSSPLLADPLRLLDCCLISDGGAAFLTTSTERARDLRQPPVIVAGVAEAELTGRNAHWSQQRELTSTPQVFSAPAAFAMAGITPSDVDVLTVYDPFTIVSLMQIEDMGFCEKGEGGAFVDGDTLFHDAGRLPFNTHGGLLSHAYVLGIAHVVEVVKQLRGTAAAQVPGAEVGVYGGYTGATTSTLVLRKDV